MERARPSARIVVIEDEDEIRDVISYNLERAGYVVECVGDGRDGLHVVQQRPPSLVVLDLMLPGIDGLEVCRRVRADAATRHVPVLMLTARGDEDDVVRGLQTGADGYVTKPFSPRELVARVEAVLRRSDAGSEAIPGPGDPAIRVGAVVVDPARHEVLVDGELVRLTPTELRLLYALLRAQGRVFTRPQLVEQVLGSNAWVTDRTIDVHVRSVRRKLGDHAGAIETVRGVGYRGRPADGSK